MFIPQNFSIALLMIIVSAVCWGSWANTFKFSKNYPFELFYWDYALGVFAISVILALTLGSLNDGATSFLHNMASADPGNIASAILGGAIFTVANIMLVAGIDMAGFSVAFPVAIGTAMVVGVALSYMLQPRGSVLVLSIGVLLTIAALIMDSKAYAALSSSASGKATARKCIIVCLVSGVLRGLFAPFVTHALTARTPLGPYSTAVFFTFGSLLSCLAASLYFMKRPFEGMTVRFHDFFKSGLKLHLPGILGGCIWGTGTVFNLVAATCTGVAISYAIGQSAPMIAAIWGIFVWREFSGSGRKAHVFLALMFGFYIMAISTVAMAYTSVQPDFAHYTILPGEVMD
jgi:glucose uptake protein